MAYDTHFVEYWNRWDYGPVPMKTAKLKGVPNFCTIGLSVRTTPVLPAPLNAKLYSTGVPPEIICLNVYARALSPNIMNALVYERHS